MDRIQNEIPLLYEHLNKNEICLEILLSSPLMTLFSNIMSFSESTHIMNMYMLQQTLLTYYRIFPPLASMGSFWKVSFSAFVPESTVYLILKLNYLYQLVFDFQNKSFYLMMDSRQNHLLNKL